MHGFSIQLYPGWRGLVERSQMDQERADHLIKNSGRWWLDSCGYDRIFDPDNCGIDYDPKKPPGPEAGPAYKPLIDLRVKWGGWGPEHIMVPGDACGLDLDHHSPSHVEGGAVLLPHNVDTWKQKNLLMIVFLHIAYSLSFYNEADRAEREAKRNAD